MSVHMPSVKFKKPLLPIGIASGLIVASVGLSASPAYALTLRTITNTNTGNILNSSGVVGNVVGAANPVPNGYVGSWYFQIFPNDEYEIHPENNTSLCLTASTTQNLDRIETCDGGNKPPTNQLWFDNVIQGNQYDIEVVDPSIAGAIDDPSSSHSNHAVNNTDVNALVWYQN